MSAAKLTPMVTGRKCALSFMGLWWIRAISAKRLLIVCPVSEYNAPSSQMNWIDPRIRTLWHLLAVYDFSLNPNSVECAPVSNSRTNPALFYAPCDERQNLVWVRPNLSTLLAHQYVYRVRIPSLMTPGVANSEALS